MHAGCFGHHDAECRHAPLVAPARRPFITASTDTVGVTVYLRREQNRGAGESAAAAEAAAAAAATGPGVRFGASAAQTRHQRPAPVL